ncbi:MAG: hypothetical protein GXX96_36220 [Planctomycetaceae bacterium]|nr:hypothetical protein [Planctomycetaceae bacterium]
MTDSTHDFFDALARILLRCWIFGFLLLLVWFGIYMLASDVAHVRHGRMFGLSQHELSVIHYCGMAFAKLVVILFFFFPWLAIRLVLKKAKG